ncbi:piwi domain-containing protein [Rutstroemia sp. NJR-2017a BVV2]|nr:piwi domain-containing protein [Rutstroemia sp. NJR-2017a BVV2]
MGSGQKHRLQVSAPPPSAQGDAKQDQGALLPQPPALSQGRPPSGGFDGPDERVNPFGPSLGFDPARDPKSQQERKFNTRVELPCYRDNYDVPQSSILPDRPGYNTQGKAVKLRVNQFKVVQAPMNDVYQYDIHIGNGAENRGLVKKVWMSRAVQGELNKHGKFWLWDGNKIAWNKLPLARGELRIMVDLDEEDNRPMERRNDDRKIYCTIKQSAVIRMAALHAYLNKQMGFDNTVLCAINFMDHLLRQYPSEMYTAQKRSFFTRGSSRFALDQVIEAMKGVYASIRLCNHIPEGDLVRGLAVNVDVANGTFWTSQDIMQAARNLCNARNRRLDYTVFRDLLRPVRKQSGGFEKSVDFKTLEKMKKLKFTVKHRGKEDNKKPYTVKRFVFLTEPKYAKEGVHSKNYTFTPKGEKETSIYDYFLKKYNIKLNQPDLPLVETEKAGVFPMEVCTLLPNQKYNYKLDPIQTAAMIKFAVTRPKARIESIKHGLDMLNWNQDPYLKHYGCKIENTMTTTNARVLQNPIVQFDKVTVDPKTSGRWDLRGKKFLFPNPEPLNSWAVCVVDRCVDDSAVKNFIQVFIQTYIGHGGRVTNKTPPIVACSGAPNQIAQDVAAARSRAGQAANAQPQILFFILPGRDSFMYERFKKNMECRFGMVSQMMNVAHVVKAQPQYCSNVCMKVNAKLGGTTCRVADSKPPKPFFSRPTMVIGADVSHASPGSPQASMAALTMSMDSTACRYAAAVQTNGSRVEMITRDNIKSMMLPLFRQWIQRVGRGAGPQHIYYFRDGVSEGEFERVLNQEVADMKEVLKEAFGAPGAQIRWTVTVCTKRHHLRFFPNDSDNVAGDKNGNAVPGTLVERDITHPFEYDFYLSSHSAIQGTARPVHYQVIMDEAKVPVNDFQRMVYQHCYQYMRSTTPVSLYPAVYYAHLASNRARAHESSDASAGPRGGQKFLEAQGDAQNRATAQGGKSFATSSQTGSNNSLQAIPLLPLGSINPDNRVDENVVNKIRAGMWYI